MTQDEIYKKVSNTLVEALNVDETEISPRSTLQGDLGAESIDFLDIVFRLESAFDLKIPEDEVWQGAFEGVGDDPELLASRLAELKARRPGFRWDRFPARPTKADLPRLITVTTVVEDLERRLAAGAEPAL